MHDTDIKHSPHGLENHGLYNLNDVYWNLPTPALYEQALERRAQRELSQPPGHEMDRFARHVPEKPPLIDTICPLTKLAAGETRKRATRATSSGVPQRCNRDSRRARSCQAAEAVLPQAVLIQPGEEESWPGR